MPAAAGKPVDLFVREKSPAAIVEAGKALPGKVVLFAHGGFSPATVAFDVPYRDYSWMGHLARAGYANKAFLAIACATHFVGWENQHRVLKRAPLEWLEKGTLTGKKSGTFRADAEGRIGE